MGRGLSSSSGFFISPFASSVAIIVIFLERTYLPVLPLQLFCVGVCGASVFLKLPAFVLLALRARVLGVGKCSLVDDDECDKDPHSSKQTHFASQNLGVCCFPEEEYLSSA